MRTCQDLNHNCLTSVLTRPHVERAFRRVRLAPPKGRAARPEGRCRLRASVLDCGKSSTGSVPSARGQSPSRGVDRVVPRLAGDVRSGLVEVARECRTLLPGPSKGDACGCGAACAQARLRASPADGPRVCTRRRFPKGRPWLMRLRPRSSRRAGSCWLVLHLAVWPSVSAAMRTPGGGQVASRGTPGSRRDDRRHPHGLRKRSARIRNNGEDPAPRTALDDCAPKPRSRICR